MADLKQKPKMDKPKLKNTDSALPKEAWRMLADGYREAADERANDAKQRPEQEAVTTVENAARSAKNHGVAAAKRAGKGLAHKHSRRKGDMKAAGDYHTTDTGAITSIEQHSSNRSAGVVSPMQTVQKREYIQNRMQNTKLLQENISKQTEVFPAELPATQQTPGFRTTSTGAQGPAASRPSVPEVAYKANAHGNINAHGIKTKTPSDSIAKAKPEKTGFSLNTKPNIAGKAKKSAQTAKELKRRAEVVADAVKKASTAALKFAKRVATMVAQAATAAVNTLIAAAGPVGVVIILFVVVAAIAALMASPFGLFYSSEDTANKDKMQQAVAAISLAYHQKIQSIIRDNSHNEMRFEYINHGYKRTDNWIDILAVFSIKTASSGNDGIDVAEMDDARAEKLSSVFWDMQDITWEVVNEPIYDAETDTNIDHYVLYLRAECISAHDAAGTYGFDHGQQEILDEMLSGEYDDLFAELIGSAGLFRAVGDGGAVVGTGNFIWPSDASTYVRSPYGPRPGVGIGNFHLGIDIAAGENTNVLAADSGVVVSNSVHSSYGNHLLIDHGNGYSTLYGHMNTLFVGVGDTVGQGQVIGLCGNTGVSFGAHIHFEIRVNGSTIDPLQLFSNYTLG